MIKSSYQDRKLNMLLNIMKVEIVKIKCLTQKEVNSILFGQLGRPNVDISPLWNRNKERSIGRNTLSLN